MLVLQRGVNEEVIITDQQTGDSIRLVVVGYRKSDVRLGFEADPLRYTIHRGEVHDAIERDSKIHPSGINLSPIPGDHELGESQ